MTHFPVARWLLAVVCLAEIPGCGSQATPDEQTGTAISSQPAQKIKADSWLHPAPTPPIPSGQLSGVTELNQKEIYEVTDGTEPQAEAMLQQLSVVPLSFEQASKFTDGKFQRSATTSPYLVRALYLNHATGGYIVSQGNTQLFVEHGSLGHSDVPMKRSALVVQLRSLPSEVFVSCSMAE